VSALIYTGTAEDRKILAAEGLLDPEDTFEVLGLSDVRQRMAWIYHRLRYDAFWRGYRVAAPDANAAIAAVEKPSLLRRITGWLS
jgi:hypothetical protein